MAEGKPVDELAWGRINVPGAITNSTDLVKTFLRIVDEADVHAGQQLEPSLSQAIVEAYAAASQLSIQAARLRGVMVGSTASNVVTLSAAERDVLLRFFDLLGSFDTSLSKLDVALLDIYAPGFIDDVTRVIGFDSNIIEEFNELAAVHGMTTEQLPPTLHHLLLNYRDGEYWNQDQVAYLKAEFAGEEMPGYGPTPPTGPEHETPGLREAGNDDPPSRLLTGQVVTLDSLCRGLITVRDRLAAVVRENWNLREIVEADKPQSLSVGVVMGDFFNNIQNSTIVNRASVEKSFNRLSVEGQKESAQALRELADVILASGNAGAAENFNAFNEELQKEKPSKFTLRSLWNGLVECLPVVAQIADIAPKITSLFV